MPQPTRNTASTIPMMVNRCVRNIRWYRYRMDSFAVVIEIENAI